MTSHFCAIVLSAVLGAGPAEVAAPPVFSVDRTVVVPGVGIAGATVPGVPCGEPRYSFDAPGAWTHGYFQEVPPFAGFNAFRPYNYKHVLQQSQIAAEWGMSPTAPYSHHFWQRYRTQAAADRESTPSGPFDGRQSDSRQVGFRQPAAELPVTVQSPVNLRSHGAGSDSAGPSQKITGLPVAAPDGRASTKKPRNPTAAIDRVTPVSAARATEPGTHAGSAGPSAVKNAIFSSGPEQWPPSKVEHADHSPDTSWETAESTPARTSDPKVIPNGGAIATVPSGQ